MESLVNGHSGTVDTGCHVNRQTIGQWTLTGKEHARNWRELTGQQTLWERLERLAKRTEIIADRHPKIAWGTTLALIAFGIALIPSLISASNEADRVLRELEVSRALRGAIVVPVPDSQVEATPSPKFELSLKPPSPADYLSKAYLELYMPTTEGKSVAEIMTELGYKFYRPPYIPEVPNELRAGDIGNRYRRLPLNWPERQFFDRFKTMNILGSVNAKEPFPSFIIQPIGGPLPGITEFYVVTDKGWVNIAQVNYNEVNLFVQDPGSEIMEILNGYKRLPPRLVIV